MARSKSSSNDPTQQQLNFLIQPMDEALELEENSEDEQDAEALLEELMGPVIYSVSQLTAVIEEVLSEDPVLGDAVIVQGELSNLKRSARGHVYFTLKDESASISGILWASLARKLNFELEDGLEVYLTGKLEIYAPSGTYSIVGQKIEPVGIGSLQLAFQQIKERLEAEGLFLPEFKQPIPEFPTRVGIITSRTGAVIHDMLRVIRRKNPLVDVLLLPATVQGEGAAEEIAAAIEELNRPEYGLDTLIVGRGGGSFEDLFCFSQEPVVRAIFNSRVPVITGIGHEPDYGLADAAADFSAATPTMAAEYAVPDVQQLIQHHMLRSTTLIELMCGYLFDWEQALDSRATRFVESLLSVFTAAESKLELSREKLVSQVGFYLQALEQKQAQMASELDAFSPLATLSRGYAIPVKADGSVLRSIKQAAPGERFQLRVSDGQVDCQVIES